MTDLVGDLYEFWFGDPVPGPIRPEWFQKSTAFDLAVTDRFGAAVEDAAAGHHDDLASTPQGAVALCLLLDQFPRNLYRGQARAFATDDAARTVADQAIRAGFDQGRADVERLFLYLPFEHSESLADQDCSMALFSALGNAHWLDYAQRHHAIIARFGRFPHRNAALGRPSTPEEEEFLKEEGSSF